MVVGDADVGRCGVDVAQLCCELCSTTHGKHSGKHQLGRHFADASRMWSVSQFLRNQNHLRHFVDVLLWIIKI